MGAAAYYSDVGSSSEQALLRPLVSAIATPWSTSRSVQDVHVGGPPAREVRETEAATQIPVEAASAREAGPRLETISSEAGLERLGRVLGRARPGNAATEPVPVLLTADEVVGQLVRRRCSSPSTSRTGETAWSERFRCVRSIRVRVRFRRRDVGDPR